MTSFRNSEHKNDAWNITCLESQPQRHAHILVGDKCKQACIYHQEFDELLPTQPPTRSDYIYQNHYGYGIRIFKNTVVMKIDRVSKE